MADKPIPIPPAPPPEVTPAGSLPGAPTGDAGGLAPPSPEVIEGAASSYAMLTGFALDAILTSRGRAPLSETQRDNWRSLWREEVKRRQFLAVGGEIPEATMLIFLVGVFITQPKVAPPPEQEQPAQQAA